MSTNCQNYHQPNKLRPIQSDEILNGKRILSSLLEAMVRRWKRREDRDAFRQLLKLDDTLLKDIGVNKADVLWASELPLSVNASVELQNLALGHKKNQDL